LKMVEELVAYGHQNILGTHSMTFEITRAPNLSRRGDCVIGVNATRAPSDFSLHFKNLCRHEGTQITILLEAGSLTDVIQGSGSPGLRFIDRNEMVGRKSSFISDRTIMVHANKAARDIKRSLINALTSPKSILKVRISAEDSI